jgi:hypothetical protein
MAIVGPFLFVVAFMIVLLALLVLMRRYYQP